MGFLKTHLSFGQLCKETFYAIPALCVVGSILLGFVLSAIDVSSRDYQDLQPRDDPFYVLFWTGDAADARLLIQLVSNFAVSFTTLTFSLTVLSLQLAATRFSSRIMIEFTKDLSTKVTLGIALGTYAYNYVVAMNLVGSECSCDVLSYCSLVCTQNSRSVCNSVPTARWRRRA
jgi:uncharacterized membrane protein